MASCKEYNTLSRRQLLGRGAVAGIATLTLPAWLPKVAFAQANSGRDVLIVVMLGGGIDGLTLCVPHADPNYYVHRTTEAVPAPSSGNANRAIDLNGFFGISPSMQPLHSVYQAGDLLFVHATGATSSGWSRSHFDAMRWMELGKPNDISMNTGWLGRHLQLTPNMKPGSPLRAISFSHGLFETLRGGPQTLPIPYPHDFGFHGWYPYHAEMIDWIHDTYEVTAEPLKSSAKYTTETVDLLQQIDFRNYQPGGGAVYPEDSDLARAMKSTAAMIRADIGLEVAMIDFGGWDTHSDQGTNNGYMREKLAELAQTLKALYVDLMAAGKTNWTLMIMSEFGRTVVQNANGTDHGTGNAMMLMGPRVIGGRVVTSWPGLHRDQLLDEQDLRVTMDYRDVVAEVVTRRLKNSNVSAVLPGFTPTVRNLLDP